MVAALPSALCERLARLLGPAGFLTDPADIEPHRREYRGLYRSAADAVARPADTAQLAETVRACVAAGAPIVPQGGNTGLCGGAVAEAGAVILSLKRMNRIRKIDPLTWSMTVEAGCVLADIQRAAAEHDMMFPLSLGSEGSCQIGGNLSTNAGGVTVLRYGNARDLTLGLEVVLPDGRIVDGLTPLRKNNTGYDLRHLFIGAEGTLGIIAAASLKLFAPLRDRAAAWVGVPCPKAAVILLSRARKQTGDSVSTFELMNELSLEMVRAFLPGASDPLTVSCPWAVLIELTSASVNARMREALEECLAAAFDEGLVLDAVIAQNEAQARLFRQMREEISDAQRPHGGSIKHDIAVPISRIAEFLEQATAAVVERLPTVRVVAFGHVGDGNMHYNLSQPVGADRAAFLARWTEFNQIVHDIAHRLGGSFSAEHGIGKLKIDELVHYKSPVEIEILQRIKHALDPAGLMNPGKMLPPRP